MATRCTGPAKIEAAVKRRRLVLPCPLNHRNSFCGDVKLRIAFLLDDMLCGSKAHLLQGIASGFKGIDLRGTELIGNGFIPVRSVHLCGGVEGQSSGLYL